MPSPSKHASSRDTRAAQPVEGLPPGKPAVSHGPTETGWLPDYVFTGEKFETGLAFFADALGRISRFSREPADLARARRLAGQAALPGLVNAHSRAVLRAMRGRAVAPERALSAMTVADAFDTARLAFMEMLLSGITCVGEFHVLQHAKDGRATGTDNPVAREILRAAHDVGIRIALLTVAASREAPVATIINSADEFVRNAEALRIHVEQNFPADDAWVGVGVYGVRAAPADYLKPIAAYARTHRMRLHCQLPTNSAENEVIMSESRRAPIALLAEQGVVDKRFTAIGAAHLTPDEAKILGLARATLCVCPTSDRQAALGLGNVGVVGPSGAGLALGSGTSAQGNLLEDARLIGEQAGRLNSAALLHAATVAGARSLGATGGGLEVGRPADFFTVNLLDPSLAGADAAALPAQIVYGLDRRAIHEVWIGARQRIAAGRHPNQGMIVSRFADAQKRIWAT